MLLLPVAVVILDEIVRVSYQFVDIFSSPVVPVHLTTAVDVFCICSIIWKSLIVVIRWIRVKIIIVVEPINVVAIQNVADDSFGVRLDLICARIEPNVLADLVRIIRILMNRAEGRKIVLLRLGCISSVRVEPAMKLETAAMRFRHSKFKWIPSWI